MPRLLRTLIIVASNVLLLLTLAAYVAGRHQIVCLRLNTPMLGAAIEIDPTGVTATPTLARSPFSLSSQTRSVERGRWERMFDSPHGWRNSAFGYHNGQPQRHSGGFGMLDVVTSPNYGVTHSFLLILSASVCVLVYHKSLRNIYTRLQAGRTPNSDAAAVASRQAAG